MLRNIETLKFDEICLLLENKADVNEKDEKGQTPLMRVIQNKGMNIEPYEEIPLVYALLEKKADINAKDNEGRTALIYAAKIKNSDPSSSSSAISVERKGAEIVALLVHCKADVDIQDNTGHSALMSTYSNLEAMRSLLKAKANVNLQRKDSKTVLLLAVNASTDVNNKHAEEIIHLLLEEKADVSLKNKEGMNAYDIAFVLFGESDYHPNIPKMLKEELEFKKISFDKQYQNAVKFFGKPELLFKNEQPLVEQVHPSESKSPASRKLG